MKKHKERVSSIKNKTQEWEKLTKCSEQHPLLHALRQLKTAESYNSSCALLKHA